jgi:3-hydroxymyristoyl/3-hydroxydecanoyl-(acyl carrier protein) dehydratase
MSEPFSLTIDPAHPSLAGHFPGDPIVPGAILLDYAIAHIERAFERKVATILAAKFLAPVRPLQTVTFRVARGDNDRVTVAASVGSTTVCSLSVALEGGAQR